MRTNDKKQHLNKVNLLAEQRYIQQKLDEDITIPIKVGDVILGGKFKNKKITVKEIGKNDKGEVTINGKTLMRFRLIDKDLDDTKE